MSPEFKERAEPESFRARNIQLSMTVNDLEKSVAWYHDVVGFTIDRKMEREGKVVATSLVAGDVRILLNQEDGAKGWDRVKGQGLSLQLTTAQDIDDIAYRIKKSGGVLESDPADMPWGARVFSLRDPDGYRWVFSTPMKAS